MRRFFQFLFMPCEGYTELLSAAMDTNLSTLDRFAVRLHAVYCKGCRRYRHQLLQLRRLLQRIDEVPADLRLPDAARDRILRAVRRDQR